MIQKATAMAVRQNLGELLNSVQYRHDKILITKAGRPVAALVDIELFEKFRVMQKYLEQLTSELGQVYKGVDRKIAEAEIAEALIKSPKRKKK